MRPLHLHLHVTQIARNTGQVDVVDLQLEASTTEDAKRYVDVAAQRLGPNDQMLRYLEERYVLVEPRRAQPEPGHDRPKRPVAERWPARSAFGIWRDESDSVIWRDENDSGISKGESDSVISRDKRD